MKRFCMIFILLVVLSPFVFGATLVLERVTMYSDGTPIPEGLVDTIRYRYYYADNGVGPYIEGTATIDNLVIAVPDPAPGTKVGYTVDSELEGVSSGKAEPQILATPLPPVSPPQQSPGCAMNRFLEKI